MNVTIVVDGMALPTVAVAVNTINVSAVVGIQGPGGTITPEILQIRDEVEDFKITAESAAEIAVDNAIASAADVVLTNADASQTALDRIATGDDASQTALDVIATAADRVQTGLDTVATAADRVQTGLDVASTGEDASQTALDAIATAADRVQTGLDANVTTGAVATHLSDTTNNHLTAAQKTIATQAASATVAGYVNIDAEEAQVFGGPKLFADGLGVGSGLYEWYSAMNVIELMHGALAELDNTKLVMAHNCWQYSDVGWKRKSTVEGSLVTLGNGVITLSVSGAGTANNPTSITDIMTILGGASRSVLIGAATDPTNSKLYISGSMTATGCSGIGGGFDASNALRITPASAITTGAAQTGITCVALGSSAADVSIYGMTLGAATSAAVYSCGALSGLVVQDAVKGAGSTIISQYGIFIDDQTKGLANIGIASYVSNGTDKWNIAAYGDAPNLFVGAVVVGSDVNDGVNKLQVAGTASFTGQKASIGTFTNNVWKSQFRCIEMQQGAVVESDALYIGLHYNAFINNSASVWIAKATGAASTITAGTDVVIYTAPLVAAGAELTFTAKMTVKSSGNVLIGTTTDDGVNKLQVVGAAKITGDFTTTGNTVLGDTSSDTVDIKGYVTIGSTLDPAMGLKVLPSTLTGTTQTAINAQVNGNSAATGSIRTIQTSVRTADAAFTCGSAYGLICVDAVRGAASAITNLYGLYVADQTQGTYNIGLTLLVSSGTNKWNIYASGTAVNYLNGNVQIGSATPTAGAEKLQVTGSSYLGGDTYVATGGNTKLNIVNTVETAGQMSRLSFMTAAASASSTNTIAAIFGVVENADNTTALKGYLQFNTNAGDSSAEKMRITSAGDVLIGTVNTDGVNKLQVTGTASFTGQKISVGAFTNNVWSSGHKGIDIQRGAIIGIDTAYIGLAYNSYVNTGGVCAAKVTGAGSFFTCGTDFRFYLMGSVAADATQTVVERMQISSAGNVLIGATTDDGVNKLQVVGSATISTKLGVGVASPIGNFEAVGVCAFSNVAGNGAIYMSGTSVNASYSTAGNAGLLLNYYGYQCGATQFRDVDIRDGKAATIAFFQGSTGRMGIGTVTPSVALDVVGAIKSSANITAGTGTDYTTAKLRNTKLMTTTPVAGDFDGNGSIIFVYTP